MTDKTIHEEMMETLAELEKGPVEKTTPEVVSTEEVDEVEAALTKPEEENPDSDPVVPEAKVEDPATEDPGIKLTADKAPSSWSPKAREKWATLPEDIRAEVTRREEASANGVRKLTEETAPIRQFTESLRPVLQEASTLGQNPVEYITRLAQAERGLRQQDPEARFQTLLGLADQYGIPLRNIINKSVGHDIVPPQQQPVHAQLPPEVVQRLDQLTQYQQQTQETTLRTQVETFKAGKEFFDDCRDTMAALIDSGQAQTLEDAYEKAQWLVPGVREVLLERQVSGRKADNLTAAQKAALGATVKTKGSAEVVVQTDKDDENDSIEDTIRKQIAASSGRV